MSSIGRRALGSRVAMSLARVVAPALPASLSGRASGLSRPVDHVRSLTCRALGQASPHSATEQQCLIPPVHVPTCGSRPTTPQMGQGSPCSFSDHRRAQLVSALCFLGRGDRRSHRPVIEASRRPHLGTTWGTAVQVVTQPRDAARWPPSPAQTRQRQRRGSGRSGRGRWSG